MSEEKIRRTFPKKPFGGFASGRGRRGRGGTRWQDPLGRNSMRGTGGNASFPITTISSRPQHGNNLQFTSGMIHETLPTVKQDLDKEKVKSINRFLQAEKDMGEREEERIRIKTKGKRRPKRYFERESREEAEDTVVQHYLGELADSDVDTDNLPEDDMFGNEREDEEDEIQSPSPKRIIKKEIDIDNLKKKKKEKTANKKSKSKGTLKKEVKEEEVDGDDLEEKRKVKEHIEELDSADEEGGEMEDDEDSPITDIDKFREEMANLPLSKVREVKETLGIKLFNEAFFGKNDSKKPTQEQAKESRFFKRENAKRPREISSKKVVSKFRPVYANTSVKTTNYAFLDEIQQEEKQKMKKELMRARKAGDTEKVDTLREEIRRLDNREKSKREKQMRVETMRELKRDNIERMKNGLKPLFIKRSEVKMKVMEKKFDQLKGEKQLDKYLRRKTKKNSRKEGMGKGPSLGL